ncbi:MAG: hypothetical protein HN719_12280, partial [Alphaproteobacteria bacterium]|nr:hypothetical protein [Alphaproteobacteria bacterium]
MEELNRLIDKDPISGVLEAEELIVEEVQAVADKISQDAEKIMAQVRGDAQSAAIKLSGEAERTVNEINKNTAKVAAKLLHDAEVAGG